MVQGINGLAILNEEPGLARYYIAGVVGGPGSFLLTADDFADFAVAMRRKLYFEIAVGEGAEVLKGLQLAPGAILGLGMLLTKESTRWLAKVGRREEALKSLVWVRGFDGPEVEAEYVLA